jgi:4-carboxymuconolactone decarboxylase
MVINRGGLAYSVHLVETTFPKPEGRSLGIDLPQEFKRPTQSLPNCLFSAIQRFNLKENGLDQSEQFAEAQAMRRAMLGDPYVDAMTLDTDPVSVEFQEYITSMAWGVWTRRGPLSPRDRSLLVMAMTAAMGRMEEFRLHASAMPRTGVTDEELDELLFQIGAYCGAPAAVSARREIKAVREQRGEQP